MQNSNEIEIIKAELQRSFDQCFNTSLRVLLVNAKNYFDFIFQTPILENIVKEEAANFENNIKNHVYKDYEFMAWPAFRDFPRLLDKHIKEKDHKMILPKTWLEKLMEYLGKTQYQNTYPKNDKKIIFTLKLTHDFLMRKIIVQQLGSYINPLPTEAVIKLGLDKEAKWKDIEIAFINDSDISIKYAEKEFKTNNEKMNLIDGRTGIKPKASWQFLQLLSMKDGMMSFDGLENAKREKLKKRKQELSAKLKEYLQIDENPFEPVSTYSRFYKFKSKLLPEPESREPWLEKDFYDQE